MQEEIARLVGAASKTIARGLIQLAYVNAPPGNLVVGSVVQFQFRLRSFATQADTYIVNIQPTAGWRRQLVDNLGNPVPSYRVALGPSGSEITLFVNVTVQAGSSQLRLDVESESNPDELRQTSTTLTLTAGLPAPPPEDRIQFALENFFRATLNPATGTVSVQRPPATQPAQVGVRIFNNTGQALNNVALDVAVVAGTQVGNWTVARAGPATRTSMSGRTWHPEASPSLQPPIPCRSWFATRQPRLWPERTSSARS